MANEPGKYTSTNDVISQPETPSVTAAVVTPGHVQTFTDQSPDTMNAVHANAYPEDWGDEPTPHIGAE